MSILRKVFLPAAASVLMLAGGCGTKKTRAPEDAERVFPRPVAGVLDSLDVYNDTTGIETLRKNFSKISMGKKYLRFADSVGVAIVFNEQRCKRLDATGAYSYESKTIYLAREDYSREDHHEKQLSDLAHEIQHSYNDLIRGTMKAKTSLLPPSRKFAIFRFDEADAFNAGEAYINELYKVSMPKEHHHRLFMWNLRGVTRGYRYHCELSIRTAQTLAIMLDEKAGTDSLLSVFSEAQTKTPTNSAYEKMLRSFGGGPLGLYDGVFADTIAYPLEELIKSYPFLGAKETESWNDIKMLARFDVVNDDNIRTITKMKNTVLKKGAP